MDTIMQNLNKFLESDAEEKEFRFKDGFFLTLKKHMQKTEPVLEIHTSEYNGTMRLGNAVEWIKAKLIDLQTNNIL